MVEKKKPSFFRKDWHKRIGLGKTVKKLRKWRAAKGRQNKIRLSIRGHAVRPKIGFGESKEIRGTIQKLKPVRVENVAMLSKVGKGEGVLVGKVGKKKKAEIIAKANQMKLTILNKYKVENESN